MGVCFTIGCSFGYGDGLDELAHASGLGVLVVAAAGHERVAGDVGRAVDLGDGEGAAGEGGEEAGEGGWGGGAAAAATAAAIGGGGEGQVD